MKQIIGHLKPDLKTRSVDKAAVEGERLPGLEKQRSSFYRWPLLPMTSLGSCLWVQASPSEVLTSLQEIREVQVCKTQRKVKVTQTSSNLQPKTKCFPVKLKTSETECACVIQFISVQKSKGHVALAPVTLLVQSTFFMNKSVVESFSK